MDPTLPKSLDRFPHSGREHLIQPLGGGDHRPYYTSVKMRSILEVCNVLGTSEMLRWLVSLSSSSSSSCQI